MSPSSTEQFICVFYESFGWQWRSMAQWNKVIQALATQTTSASSSKLCLCPIISQQVIILLCTKLEVITLHRFYLQVFDSEDHGLRQVNLIALLVNGCCDDRGVDDNRVIRVDRLAAQSDAGVLCGQVGPQVPVQDKGHPDLTCKGTPGNIN